MLGISSYLIHFNSNPIKYGNIEKNSPKKLPFRENGLVSMDLNIKDIPGAQAGTKGLGVFATKARQTFHNTVTTMDIKGAQAGTIKNGPLSKRMTNPITPDYPILGAKEMPREDNIYAEPWKEMPIKKTCTRTKPEWKKSNVIPVIEDKKVEAKEIATVDLNEIAAMVRIHYLVDIGSKKDKYGKILWNKFEVILN